MEVSRLFYSPNIHSYDHQKLIVEFFQSISQKQSNDHLSVLALDQGKVGPLYRSFFAWPPFLP